MSIDTLYILWIALFLLAIPPIVALYRSNPVIGFRFASALSDPQIWRRSNTFFGRALMIGSIAGAAFTYLFPVAAGEWGLLLLLGVLMIVVVVSFLYMKRISRPD